MERCATFTYSLVLAIRLLDTSTGEAVSANQVVITADETPLKGIEKTQGMIIYQALDKEEFQLVVTSRDYEPYTATIRRAELPKGMPIVDVQLVPSGRFGAGAPCLTIQGRLEGLESITAVRAGNTACLIRGFDARKKLVSLFNPHRLGLERVHYALVNPDTQTFESFKIVRNISEQEFKVDRPLETEFRNYYPVCPIVFGQVDSEGNYCLRVRDDITDPEWMVCYVVDGAPSFQTVTFEQTQTVALI